MALSDLALTAIGGLGFLTGVGIAVAVLGVIALYVYTAFVTLTIAKKTHVGPTWLAWVPIANIVLLLKTAKLQWQWIFALFVTMIPVIGGALLMAGSVYVWWKVCKAMHKLEWLSILMIVPVVNLIVMGYVAWAD